MKWLETTLVASCLCAVAACGGDGGSTPQNDTSVGDTTTDTSETDTVSACGGAEGTLGCACHADQSCDTGLTCAGGVCATAASSGLELPGGARGCEILLSEGGGIVTSVTFGAGVNGTFIREAPHVAITVVGAGDADFAGDAVTVVGTATPPATIASARCVDAAGAVIDGAAVTFP